MSYCVFLTTEPFPQPLEGAFKNRFWSYHFYLLFKLSCVSYHSLQCPLCFFLYPQHQLHLRPLSCYSGPPRPLCFLNLQDSLLPLNPVPSFLLSVTASGQLCSCFFPNCTLERHPHCFVTCTMSGSLIVVTKCFPSTVLQLSSCQIQQTCLIHIFLSIKLCVSEDGAMISGSMVSYSQTRLMLVFLSLLFCSLKLKHFYCKDTSCVSDLHTCTEVHMPVFTHDLHTQ